MSEFNRILGLIEKNRHIKMSGGLTSIPPPFPRLSEYYGGFTRGTITCLTSNSGTGKTKLAKYFEYLQTDIQYKYQAKSVLLCSRGECYRFLAFFYFLFFI